MVLSVIQHIPHWVWFLLIALIAIGVRQSLPHRRSLRRATLFPLAMIALSFYGVVTAFPSQPLALAAWAAGVGAALMAAVAVGAWSGIRWLAADERLVLPGSWAPLALMLGIFFLKFGVGVSHAVRPELAYDTLFSTAIAFAYGAFSGVFFSRAVAMWKVAHAALREGIAA